MTGSGTQANMNVNEVISNRAIEISGETKINREFMTRIEIGRLKLHHFILCGDRLLQIPRLELGTGPERGCLGGSVEIRRFIERPEVVISHE